MFGERQHRDKNFDRMYTNFPLLGRSRWAWVYRENAIGGFLVGACRPINRMIPDDATGPNSSSNTRVRQKLSSTPSGHTGGVNVTFADGSVWFLTNGTEQWTLWALATRAAGEVATWSTRWRRNRRGEPARPDAFTRFSHYIFAHASQIGDMVCAGRTVPLRKSAFTLPMPRLRIHSPVVILTE